MASVACISHRYPALEYYADKLKTALPDMPIDGRLISEAVSAALVPRPRNGVASAAPTIARRPILVFVIVPVYSLRRRLAQRMGERLEADRWCQPRAALGYHEFPGFADDSQAAFRREFVGGLRYAGPNNVVVANHRTVFIQ